jgi:hypothetical protein
MKRIVVMVIMLAVGMAWVYGQTPAAIVDIRGTVEIKAPGASAWRAAAEGEALERETLVSTGFRSTAQIRIGNSTIQVKPLTRLSLEEIQAASEGDRVAIQLRTGRVRAEVNAASEQRRMEFTVRSPIATASVRGTVFEFDTVNLSVTEGVVQFSGSDSSVVYVGGGQSSAPDPVSGRSAAAVDITVAQAAPPPAGAESMAAPPQVIPGPVLQASVNVAIDWD